MYKLAPIMIFFAYATAQSDKIPTINFAPPSSKECRWAYGTLGVDYKCYETTWKNNDGEMTSYLAARIDFPRNSASGAADCQGVE